jgi:mannose-6-phosphate isomerase-like protein (cupin superfamily)
MIKLIQAPSIIEAAGNIPKKIEEYFGRVNSGTTRLSIARMNSQQGWQEPGQTPEFDEYTVVLEGTLKVETKKDEFYIHAGQAIMVGKGEWVRYSSPENGGARYIAVCIPAYSPENVNREEINEP